jgi:endonuclease-3
MPRQVRKQPFDIERAFPLIREAVRGYAAAAMFELRDRGHGDLFQQLVACILSIRTRDEVSLPVALRLLARAAAPAQLARLPERELRTLIAPGTFAETKAPQLLALAERTEREFGGELPCNGEVLRSFRGVGPKCANLALGIACGEARISVDVHVHRVTNRWGIVKAPTPERTLLALEDLLPRRDWIELNQLLVPFGKHICTGRLPRCSTCPLLAMCRQVGVSAHR